MPRPTSAMPATCATGMATPPSSWPSNSSATSDGMISSASPVAISTMVAKMSDLCMAGSPTVLRIALFSA